MNKNNKLIFPFLLFLTLTSCSPTSSVTSSSISENNTQSITLVYITNDAAATENVTKSYVEGDLIEPYQFTPSSKMTGYKFLYWTSKPLRYEESSHPFTLDSNEELIYGYGGKLTDFWLNFYDVDDNNFSFDKYPAFDFSNVSFHLPKISLYGVWAYDPLQTLETIEAAFQTNYSSDLIIGLNSQANLFLKDIWVNNELIIQMKTSINLNDYYSYVYDNVKSPFNGSGYIYQSFDYDYVDLFFMNKYQLSVNIKAYPLKCLSEDAQEGKILTVDEIAIYDPIPENVPKMPAISNLVLTGDSLSWKWFENDFELSGFNVYVDEKFLHKQFSTTLDLKGLNFKHNSDHNIQIEVMGNGDITSSEKKGVNYKHLQPEYTVIFNPANGQTSFTEVYKEGVGVEFTIPYQSGKDFNGWYTSNDGGVTLLERFSNASQLTESVELYAEWIVPSPPIAGRSVLSSPQVSISRGRASWNNVSGASIYNVQVVTPNKTDEFSTSQTFVDLNDYFVDDVESLTIRVRSFGDGITTISSPWISRSLSIIENATLKIETNLDNGVWFWKNIAAPYQVEVINSQKKIVYTETTILPEIKINEQWGSGEYTVNVNFNLNGQVKSVSKVLKYTLGQPVLVEQGQQGIYHVVELDVDDKNIDKVAYSFYLRRTGTNEYYSDSIERSASINSTKTKATISILCEELIGDSYLLISGKNDDNAYFASQKLKIVLPKYNLGESEVFTYNQFEYRKINDNTEIEVVGFTEKYDGRVRFCTIPSEIDGLPVTVIGENALKFYHTSFTMPYEYSSSDKTFVIPSTIKLIKKNAIYGLSAKTIIFKSESVILKDWALSNCHFTGDVTLDGNQLKFEFNYYAMDFDVGGVLTIKNFDILPTGFLSTYFPNKGVYLENIGLIEESALHFYGAVVFVNDVPGSASIHLKNIGEMQDSCIVLLGRYSSQFEYSDKYPDSFKIDVYLYDYDTVPVNFERIFIYSYDESSPTPPINIILVN